MLEYKEDFQKAVNELKEDVSNSYSSVSNLKSEIVKIIDSINEFIAIENFQVNDAYSNIEKINELIETYPKLKEVSKSQKLMLESLNITLQKSIEQIYNLQAESVNMLDKFDSFQGGLEKERYNIGLELNKTSEISHLNIQINKIIAFKTNMFGYKLGNSSFKIGSLFK